jgi:pyruvate carboxylase
MESNLEPLLMAPFKTPKQIKRLMCCNRGEIAIRVFRCCKENGIRSIAIYSEQDKLGLHRYKADEAYKVEAPNGSPVGAYLAIDAIISIAKQHRIDAIHPGYGFLSENSEMAEKCRDNGIIFIGPHPETIIKMGDKTAAKTVAKECNVPVVPGTESALLNKDEAFDWC